MTHNMYDWESSLLWRDENFDLASLAGAASLPDQITIPGTGIKVLSFDGNNTQEEVFGVKEINHDYAQGTLIYPHVHWYPTVSGTTNVKWNFEYWACDTHSSTVTVSGILPIIVTVSGLPIWSVITTHFPALDLGVLARIGTQVHFHFYRNPSDPQDTYPADAAVATFGWHYKTDARGSNLMTSKG